MSLLSQSPDLQDDPAARLGPIQSPFLRAPETVRTIFLTVLLAATGPLAAGTFFFGYRALVVAVWSIGSCVAFEWLYYRLTRVPALLGRSHAYLTGMLLALTLPAHVPWYVPVVGAAFAVLVGKAIFGGVGHFLWQPALVGRLAVAVLFAGAIDHPAPLHPEAWPLLAQNKVIVGDIRSFSHQEDYRAWRGAATPTGRDAYLVEPPDELLEGLTLGEGSRFSALAEPGKFPGAKPAMIEKLPPVSELLYGARPGGIGETCAVAIVICGLYLVYRHYVKWQLPAAFILAACAVAAMAPIQLQGPADTVISGWGPPGGWLSGGWLAPLDQWAPPPLLREGLDVGFLYVCYQLLAGQFLLAAFFLAPEMTSRPVTTGGQVLFGLGAGAAAMLLQLYVDVPTPAYVAVLLMNTFTPLIDAMWRPRVFGTRRWRCGSR